MSSDTEEGTMKNMMVSAWGADIGIEEERRA
jgi:hypothetical protein